MTMAIPPLFEPVEVVTVTGVLRFIISILRLFSPPGLTPMPPPVPTVVPITEAGLVVSKVFDTG